jgi:hypothetical protein
MANMARHVPSRELHLGSSGSNNTASTRAYTPANTNNGKPTLRRDLIDTSAVKDSLNALPGFKTSAGKRLFPTNVLLEYVASTFLSPLLQFQGDRKQEAK